MPSRPPYLVPVPEPDDAARPEPVEVSSSLSEAELLQALIDAGHPSTAPDVPSLYPLTRPDAILDVDDR